MEIIFGDFFTGLSFVLIGLFKILFEYVALFDYVLYSVLNLFSRDFDYIDTTLGTIEVKTAKWYIPLNRLVSKVLQHWLKLAKFRKLFPFLFHQLFPI